MRRPKPSHLRILEGNRGHRPINKREPKIAADLGEPPHWFNEHQRRTWEHAKEYCPRGMLKETDRAVLTAFCVHEFNMTEAQRQMEGQPTLIQQPPSMRLVEHPLCTRVRDESRAMSRCMDQLGFSPASRTRVHVEITGSDNEFDDLEKPARSVS